MNETIHVHFPRIDIPPQHFGEWLYGKGEDFPGAMGNDIPPLMKSRGLVRVGFVPKAATIVSGSYITINNSLFRAVPTVNYDFTNHLFLEKRSVDGWILTKINSSKSQEEEQSGDASEKQ